MKYSSQKMSLTNAEIISRWKYDKPYEIYSMGDDDETIDELINCNYYSIHQGLQLVGYYCLGNAAQVPAESSNPIYEEPGYVDIGLGMKPKLTGNGLGKHFLAYIVKCAKDQYPDSSLRLTVAAFNKRAIHLYKKLWI